ncbi:hypothetical protein U1Q18_011753, partial [Sarracenia purpurea var. burkii]
MATASCSGLSGALASWSKLIAIGCSRALGLLPCLEPRLGKSLVAKVCVSLAFAWMQLHGMGYCGWPTCYSRHDLSSNGLDTCYYRLLAWAVVAWA